MKRSTERPPLPTCADIAICSYSRIRYTKTYQFAKGNPDRVSHSLEPQLIADIAYTHCLYTQCFAGSTLLHIS
jgi:hypothetical protein